MLRESSLLRLCLLASLCSAALSTRASAESPIVFDDLVGTYIGTMESEDVLRGDNDIILRVQSPGRNTVVGLLPDLEQENLVATLKSDQVRFASDGIGLCFLFGSEDGDAATLTGWLDGPAAPGRPAIAFLRPFAKPGCELPAEVHPGIMRLDGASLENVTLEVIDAHPGLFTADLIDEAGHRFDLVGTTAADGRFLATGVGNGNTIRLSGELTANATGHPTAIEANITIEDRYGKPIANGIIAILIGLWDAGPTQPLD